MRYRKSKNYKEKMVGFYDSLFVDSEKIKPGNWNNLFENNNPIMIEVGCGKGGFLIELAKRNENINYIGIEKVEPLVLEALDEIKREGLQNILFTSFDANHIDSKFEKNEISRIYLNFSDPWPKKRHSKRRLTSINFLKKYRAILNSEKEIIFKSDNVGLFEFTLIELSLANALITSVDINLHSKEKDLKDEKYILTEYEKRFLAQGISIYRVTANL